MRWMTSGVVAVVAAGAALGARRLLKARRGGSWPAHLSGGSGQRAWHSVTVIRPASDVAPNGRLPEPLAALGDRVEVRLRPAPGDRGTEIAVRLREGEPSGLGAVRVRLAGDDPRWAVRRALRDAKQLLETGEILRPSKPPTAERTLRNRALEYATTHGKEEGRL
jgi:hypothetical protein